MRRFRFTIASLLGLVVFVAVGFAAMREATDLWDSGIFGVTMLTLLTAVLLAVHRRNDPRAFWLGFCLFGGVYLIASVVPPVESRLPTTRGLAYLDSKVSDRVMAATWILTTSSGTSTTTNAVQTLALAPDGSTLAVKGPGSLRLWSTATGKLLSGPNGTSENFVRIGHSLLALALATLGAHLSRYLYTTGRSERAGEPDVLPRSSSSATRT